MAVPVCRLCPVHTYRNMCKKVLVNQFGPAFVLLIYSKRVYVSYHQYQMFFKMCLQMVDQDPVRFSSHSFR